MLDLDDKVFRNAYNIVQHLKKETTKLEGIMNNVDLQCKKVTMRINGTATSLLSIKHQKTFGQVYCENKNNEENSEILLEEHDTAVNNSANLYKNALLNLHHELSRLEPPVLIMPSFTLKSDDNSADQISKETESRSGNSIGNEITIDNNSINQKVNVTSVSAKPTSNEHERLLHSIVTNRSGFDENKTLTSANQATLDQESITNINVSDSAETNEKTFARCKSFDVPILNECSENKARHSPLSNQSNNLSVENIEKHIENPQLKHLDKEKLVVRNSNHKSLFNSDTDSEDDLFKNISKLSSKIKKSNFETEKLKSEPVVKEEKMATSQKSAISNLFEDSDSECDLFAKPSNSSTAVNDKKTTGGQSEYEIVLGMQKKMEPSKEPASQQTDLDKNDILLNETLKNRPRGPRNRRRPTINSQPQ